MESSCIVCICCFSHAFANNEPDSRPLPQYCPTRPTRMQCTPAVRPSSIVVHSRVAVVVEEWHSSAKAVIHIIVRSQTRVEFMTEYSELKTHGKRKQGRPRITWRRTFTDDLRAIDTSWDETEEIAENRDLWKHLSALCADRRRWP